MGAGLSSSLWSLGAVPRRVLVLNFSIDIYFVGLLNDLHNYRDRICLNERRGSLVCASCVCEARFAQIPVFSFSSKNLDPE